MQLLCDLRCRRGSALAGGAACTIDVAFDPANIGYLTGVISIIDNAPGSPQTVLLNGSGTDIQLAPAALRLGSEQVGATSASKKITLTNKGTVTLNIAGISLAGTEAGDFAEISTCSKRLVAGSSCYVSVTFSQRRRALERRRSP